MSSVTKRKLYFIGEKHEATNNLVDHLTKIDENFFDYEVKYGYWENFYVYLQEHTPNLLLVDFSLISKKEQLYKYISHISRIKNSEAFRHLLVVGIFNNAETLKSYKLLFNCGINYFHIIGDDFKLFFGNLYYIAFEDESNSLKLAHAKKLQIKQEFTHYMHLASVSSMSLRFESDVNVGEKFIGKINNFFENNLVAFDVLEEMPKTEQFPQMSSYEASYVFSSGWDDPGFDIPPIFEDVVDSWLTLLHQDQELVEDTLVYMDYFSEVPAHAFVRAKDLSLEQVRLNVVGEYFDDYYKENKTPDVIIYEIGTEASIDRFENLMTHLENDNSQIIVLLKNHPSNVAALRKLYQYDYIMPFPDTIGAMELAKMMALISHKKGNDTVESLKLASNHYTTELKFNCTITSITENEITFMTDKEIPYFTNLHIMLSDRIIPIIVVPSYMNLSPNIKGYHYMSLVMGVEDKDRQFLRKQVKAFLNHLPQNWGDISLETDEDTISHIDDGPEEKEAGDQNDQDAEAADGRRMSHEENSDESRPNTSKKLVEGGIMRKKTGDAKSKL